MKRTPRVQYLTKSPKIPQFGVLPRKTMCNLKKQELNSTTVSQTKAITSREWKKVKAYGQEKKKHTDLTFAKQENDDKETIYRDA